MSVPRPRAAVAALGAAVLSLLISVAPSAGAVDPLAAVDALVERIRAGDLGDLDGVVCESERAGVREQFDIVGQIAESTGLEAAEVGPNVTLSLDDVSTDIRREGENAVTVRLQARLTVGIDEALAEAFVRSLADDFGEEVPEAELAELVATLMGQMSEPRDIEEDIGVVREGGEWLVCDPFTADAGTPDGGGAEFSFDGLCGLVTLDEVNATGDLTFDSSSGDADYCSYSSSDADTYVSLDGLVDRFNDVGDIATLYPDGRAVTVAGRTGLIADGILYVGLPGGGTFVVTLYIDDGTGSPGAVDTEAQQLAFAELLVPRIPEADPEATSGNGPDPFGGELPLCDALSLAEVSDLSGIDFDTLDGDGEFCSYSTSGFEQGFNIVTLSITPLATTADFIEFLTDPEEITVGGADAIESEDQLYIDTPFGLLVIGAFGSDAEGEPSFDPVALGGAIFRLVAPRLEDLEPVAGGGGGEESGGGPADEAIVSEDSLCALLDLDALNELGPLRYDDVFDGGADLCVYSATAPDQGFHSLSVFVELFELDGIKEVYDGGTVMTIGGREAYGHDETLWLQLDHRVLAISPLLDDAEVDPGTDELGLATMVAELMVTRAEAE